MTAENILLSYWYLRNADMDKVLEPHQGAAIFADSGAYSASTTGAKIDIHDYAQWLIRWRHHFEVYSNLDVIGDPDATMRNQSILEDRYGLTPLPVFHTGSPWDRLERLVDQYDYIALGGMAMRKYNNGKRILMPWLIRCFQMAEGRAQFHGFGVTDWRVMSVLPWRSVDSTSWMMGQRYGSQLIYAHNRLFQTRAPGAQRYDRELQRLGFSAADVRRACAQKGDVALARSIALASLAKAQDHLRRKFGTDMRIYLAGLL